MADNLYTSGGEYVLPTGEEYIGEYHTHPSMGAMVGPVHTDEPHDRLTPIANLRSTDDGDENGVFQIGGYKPHSGVTLGFSTKSNVWRSRYGFVPTCYSTLDNFMLSHLKPNDVDFVGPLNPQGYTTDIISWGHEGTNLDELNIFYNVSYTSSLEVVSNHNPSSVKIFKAISIEGSGNWGGNAYTNIDRGGNPQQESSGFEFEEKEGAFYSDIPSSITDDPNDRSRELMFVGFVRVSDMIADENTVSQIVNLEGIETTDTPFDKWMWTIPLATQPEVSLPISEGTALWFAKLDQDGMMEDLFSLYETPQPPDINHGLPISYEDYGHGGNLLRPMGYNSADNSMDIMTEMTEGTVISETSSLGLVNFIEFILENTTSELIPIYVSQPISKTGEMLRGHYMGANISGTGEIFAINVDFEKTKLDGSLG